MIFFVGSKNPVKINATKSVVNEKWSDAEVIGVDAPSGVSPQPFSDAETKLGAENRAKAALSLGIVTLDDVQQLLVQEGKTIALGIGMEGGVMKEDSELWSTVWVCVFHPKDGTFFSGGARFRVPDEIAQPMLAGIEMGEVGKHLMGGLEIKQQQGIIGIITENFLARTEEYAGIVKLALGLWHGRNWADKLVQTHKSTPF